MLARQVELVLALPRAGREEARRVRPSSRTNSARSPPPPPRRPPSRSSAPSTATMQRAPGAPSPPSPRTVASITPEQRPRQPAWAAPITPASKSANRTGAQFRREDFCEARAPAGPFTSASAFGRRVLAARAPRPSRRRGECTLVGRSPSRRRAKRRSRAAIRVRFSRSTPRYAGSAEPSPRCRLALDPLATRRPRG